MWHPQTGGCGLIVLGVLKGKFLHAGDLANAWDVHNRSSELPRDPIQTKKILYSRPKMH